MQENRSSYKIYSRNRLNIFKGNNKHRYIYQDKKSGNFIYFLIIIFIAIFTFNILYKSVDPIFKTLCEEKAHEIATIVTNEESTKVMSNYNYGDMFTVEKDDSRKYKDDKWKYFYNK